MRRNDLVALDISRHRFREGNWWVWLYRDGTGKPSSWERYSVRSRVADELVIDMASKFEEADAFHAHHRMRLNLGDALCGDAKDWEFGGFAFCQDGDWREAPQRDNTQAFEEKFDVFLMGETLDVHVVRERELDVRGVGERALLVQTQRHEYTGAWYVSAPRRLAGLAAFKAFGKEGLADTFTFELISMGSARDSSDFDPP